MTFPRYPDYKDSGVEWLGEVPGHWSVVPLRAVAREQYISNAGMICDNLLSLSYGRIVEKDISSNDGLLPESFETYQVVEPGNIVLRLTDLQNDQRSLRSAIVPVRGIITSAYTSIEAISVHPEFLSYLLRAYDITKVFYSMGGGLRQTLKYEDLRKLPVSVPSAAEQSAIATFLDRETAKIDALVAEQERLIALLKEKRQAVISHAVTKGLDPNVRMKDSGVEWLGEVPEHWTVRKLVQITNGIGDGLHGTPEYADGGNFYFINGNNLKDGCIDINDSTRIVSDRDAQKYKIDLDNNTLLISINGTIGNLALYCNENVILGKSACYIVCGELVSREYLFFYLQSIEASNYIDLELSGTTISNLSLESVRNLKVPLASIAEQQAIVAVISRSVSFFDSLIIYASTVVGLLKERRSALISAAVTGKIDVRGLVQTEEAA